MKNLTDNEKKASQLANLVNKNNGIIVYSGTIALLSALKLSNIQVGDKVVISGYSCYSLFVAMSNLGIIPIIIKPQDFFKISDEEINNIFKRNDIKCMIVVHQYGIVQNVRKIREKVPNIIIIEDIAQAWNIQDNGNSAGLHSDYVITSFGKTKPLSLGSGGAIFSNNELSNKFDLHDKNSREKENVLLPYATYQCDNLDVSKLIINANNIVQHQRNVAELLTSIFEDDEHVTIYKDYKNDSSCWHRFPIVINNPEYLTYLQKIFDSNNILYQLQNLHETWELDMVKKYKHEFIGTVSKPIYILIRTRQNNLNNIKKLVKKFRGK